MENIDIDKLEEEFKATSAYDIPDGREAIDATLALMRVANKKGDKGRVIQLLEGLAQELAGVLENSMEAAEIAEGFKKQYGERLDELDAFEVIDFKASPDIRGIDGNLYRAPLWEQVEAGFTPNKIWRIEQLESPILLLVPDGMSLNELAERAGDDKSPPKKKLNSEYGGNLLPAFSLNADKNGDLISDAAIYQTVTHGGKTKLERLREPGALGWQVLVVDGGPGAPSNTGDMSADNLLSHRRAPNFGGLSVEAFFALQMHGMMKEQPFGTKVVEWLLESYYVPSSANHTRGVVMCAHYGNGANVSLCGFNPEERGIFARRSVRIL